MFGHETVPGITPTDVYTLASEGWMLLDVRTAEEWADGRIDGSTHIPLDQLVQRLDEVDDRVVCICAVGGRSAQATKFLIAQDKEALNLQGGVQAWAGHGLPLTTA